MLVRDRSLPKNNWPTLLASVAHRFAKLSDGWKPKCCLSKRIFVADWSRDDIDEMFTLRQMLEVHATRRAAERFTLKQIAELEAVNSQLHEAVECDPPDITRFLNLNRSFHEIITQAARSPRLAQVLAMLVEQPVVLRTARHYSAKDLKQSARDHDELIAAFKAGDPEWAEGIMGSHLRRAFHAFADAMSEQSERHTAE